MATTYDPIATTTLGSAASSISFSSINSAYTDLRVVLVGTTTAAGDWNLTYNGTTTGYSMTYMFGDGTSASTSRVSNAANINMTRALSTSTTIPTMYQIDIFSYAGSTNKTCLFSGSEDLNGLGVTNRGVGLWQNTAAITTVTITMPSTTFAVGTIATLYGIKAA
jgi:hypothetical protein